MHRYERSHLADFVMDILGDGQRVVLYLFVTLESQTDELVILTPENIGQREHFKPT